jgi:hypothetical protein
MDEKCGAVRPELRRGVAVFTPGRADPHRAAWMRSVAPFVPNCEEVWWCSPRDGLIHRADSYLLVFPGMLIDVQHEII